MNARFEVLQNVRTFLCIFMSSFRIFMLKVLWVNIPVAIFFGTVDNICTCNDPVLNTFTQKI